MGKITVVTGGARSGKSSYAEQIAKGIGLDEKVLYIATAIAFDEEMQDRVNKHKEARPKHWETYEGFENLHDIILEKGDKYNTILLDCITVMITNIMFNNGKFDEYNITQEVLDEIESSVTDQLEKLLASANEKKTHLIMVTNEVGSSVVPEAKLARVFRDLAGRANQLIAKGAHEVYLLVSGIPVKIK